MSSHQLQSSCQSVSTSPASQGDTTHTYSAYYLWPELRGIDGKPTHSHSKSQRLQGLQCRVPQLKHVLPSPTESHPIGDEVCPSHHPLQCTNYVAKVDWNQKTLQDSPDSGEASTPNRKRKHSPEAESSHQDRPAKKYARIQPDSGIIEEASNDDFGGSSRQDQPVRESARISPDSCVVKDQEAAGNIDIENEHSQQEQQLRNNTQGTLESCVVAVNEVPVDHNIEKGNPIYHWIQEGSWPKAYFTQGHWNWKSLEFPLYRPKRIEQFQQQQERDTRQAAKSINMAQLFVSPTTVSAHKPDVSYEESCYPALFEEKGIFLRECKEGIIEECKNMCENLLHTPQATPQDSLFRDDLFHQTCSGLQDRNKARIINDIGRLIVPSAETLATYGNTLLNDLIVLMNERWNECISITAELPKPDYCVGFRRSAFTRDQLDKLSLFTGDVFSALRLSSYVLATWQTYFPFFACEVKSGAESLKVADRQNAHSMTVAVMGVVQLFKYVRRESELHRKILGFSISHDDKMVYIYGHYPRIDGDEEITFHRHVIGTFFLTEDDGKRRWTAYTFVRNIYEIFMPDHLTLICSAIDDIADNVDLETASVESGGQDGPA